MTTPVAPVLPGETLGGGKYRVERILGQGGMGIVVAAKHVELDERVAIKFLLGEPGTAAVDRFLREARAAVKVKGEHVCRVLDFGRLESGEPYIVMEYLEGTDLSRLVERGGAQKPTAAVGWIVEACDALAEAHSLGIVHRDIKPANIFLAKRGDETSVAKVLDFGISKLPSQAQMTGTQASMGSPAYMSPEQMESARDVDGRTDIWSLGVTLYELLSGKTPFLAESMVQLTVMVREKDPPPLEGVADGLAAVVRKCLAKDPKDRFQTIGGLVAALEPFAPEEVLGLVRRHARRDSISGGAAALAATALEVRSDAERLRNAQVQEDDAEKHQLTESRRDKTGEKAVGVGKGTFAPLQSTLDRSSASNETKRRSWSTLAIAAGLVGALAVGGAYLSRSPATPAGTPSSSPEPSASIKEEPTSHIAASASVPSHQPPVASISSAEPSSKPSPIASATSAKPTSAVPSPVAKTTPPAATTDAATPIVAATPTSAPSATPAKPEPKKRRDLDRDDP